MTALLLAMWAATASAVAWMALVRVRAQTALVARAAHEVRGGLAVAQLALDGGRVAAVPPQLARAGRALDDLDRARVLGHDVLDLRSLVQAVCAPWPEVRLVLPAHPLYVRGDGPALTQACTNLVANAVEHGEAPVTIVGRRLGGRARVEVSDGGTGLPAPLTTLARDASGARGHGLAVARDVARRHGGHLATAPAARGTTLVLDLPAG